MIALEIFQVEVGLLPSLPTEKLLHVSMEFSLYGFLMGSCWNFFALQARMQRQDRDVKS